MKKFKDFLSKPAVTVVLFAIAVALLAGSAIGGTRAALNIQSEFYNSEVELLNIGVSLLEKSTPIENLAEDYVVVSGKNSLMGENSAIAKEIAKDKKTMPGKAYPEVLAVLNTGDINEYVRVAVYKYWLDPDGNKHAEMDSQWIELGFTDKDSNSRWTIDSTKFSSTEERTILYYSDMIAPGERTDPFLKTIRINEEATRKITVKTENMPDGSIRYDWTYDYNGSKFCIEVHVDSVQDHNASAAKTSAWGVDK